MANRLQRMRAIADDILRVTGVWMAAVAVVTLVAATTLAATAYVRGVPFELVLLLGGIAIGSLIPLTLAIVLWVINRRRIKAALIRADEDVPAGFLDNKKDSLRGMARLNAIQGSLSGVVQPIGRAMSQATAIINFARPRLSEHRSDALLITLANITAWRIRRHSVKYAALVVEFEVVTDRTVKTQGAWFTWVLTTDKPKEELVTMRDSLAGLSDQFDISIQTGTAWAASLNSANQATRSIIAANRRLATLIERFVQANQKYSTHTKNLIKQINSKLASAAHT